MHLRRAALPWTTRLFSSTISTTHSQWWLGTPDTVLPACMAASHVLTSSGTWRTGTVGGHLFDMVRVRSDDGVVDMFFPDWHVWLQSASVTGGPRPFDCDNLPDRPPDDEQDMYDEVNRLTGRDPDRDYLVPKALTAEGLATLEKRVTDLEASHPGMPLFASKFRLAD